MSRLLAPIAYPLNGGFLPYSGHPMRVRNVDGRHKARNRDEAHPAAACGMDAPRSGGVRPGRPAGRACQADRARQTGRARQAGRDPAVASGDDAAIPDDRPVDRVRHSGRP